MVQWASECCAIAKAVWIDTVIQYTGCTLAMQKVASFIMVERYEVDCGKGIISVISVD